MFWAMKQTNSMLWGVVAGLGAAVMVVLSDIFGTVRPDNPLLSNAGSAAGVAFFWGWVAGNIKNWLGERLFERFLAKERESSHRHGPLSSAAPERSVPSAQLPVLRSAPAVRTFDRRAPQPPDQSR